MSLHASVPQICLRGIKSQYREAELQMIPASSILQDFLLTAKTKLHLKSRQALISIRAIYKPTTSCLDRYLLLAAILSGLEGPIKDGYLYGGEKGGC